jgi:hypothetical protein
MKKKLDNNTQLKFRFEKTEPHPSTPSNSEGGAKLIKFDPKSELYKRILNRK